VAIKKHTSFLLEVGNLVRKERLKTGISQGQLAFEIKTSLRQIQRIEAGEVNTGLLSLYKIADVLNVDVKKLLP
jgi:transcriptional regulator with XRE-family HTH domain